MRPYTWRQAIQKAVLPSTTKHVLLNLSCYINDAGQAAFPSIAQQAADTGLSKRAVITHLKSVEGRWLSVSKHGFGGQKWARNEYLPRLPDEADLDVKGVMGDPPEPKKGGESGSPPFWGQGGEPGDKKVVNVVHPNRPVEQTNNTHSPRSEGDLLAVPVDLLRRWFDTAFWAKYPKRVNRAQALAELERLRPDAVLLEAIAAGLDHRLEAQRHAHAKREFFAAWPDPHRWLRKRRWEDRFEVPHETGGVPKCHCGKPGITGDGRRWYCATHDPDRRPA